MYSKTGKGNSNSTYNVKKSYSPFQFSNEEINDCVVVPEKLFFFFLLHSFFGEGAGGGLNLVIT